MVKHAQPVLEANVYTLALACPADSCLVPFGRPNATACGRVQRD